MPLHADGARIWESVPHWGRSLAEAADLFDSMYVSLYKGLGASSGALVVCPEDLAGELRSWRQRMGLREVNERVVALVEERGVIPCGLWSEADVPGWVQTELTCYEAAITRDPGEVAALVAEAVGAATFLP
ncbi:hypothetical protein EXE59_16000 [Nocardioides eburneiflavus]|uniref:Aromatic amino acid beta-eliminating lyase/threonine aldolase domain-containing protein n=1 Tax=Nocardioides eburneiflavus TaxID=2518372 RepID=A0A4Z1C775_9ACTN|nr:hypothetical protein EXE59_16000 [Nocardioides eburneiflavus]